MIQLGLYDPCDPGDVRLIGWPMPDTPRNRLLFRLVIRGFNSTAVLSVFAIGRDGLVVTRDPAARYQLPQACDAESGGAAGRVNE